jgi:hypothetical protein
VKTQLQILILIIIIINVNIIKLFFSNAIRQMKHFLYELCILGGQHEGREEHKESRQKSKDNIKVDVKWIDGGRDFAIYLRSKNTAGAQRGGIAVNYISD